MSGKLEAASTTNAEMTEVVAGDPYRKKVPALAPRTGDVTWRVEWASHALLGDMRAEVLLANQRTVVFEDDEQARDWLEKNEFVEAARARLEQLVASVPDDA